MGFDFESNQQGGEGGGIGLGREGLKGMMTGSFIGRRTMLDKMMGEMGDEWKRLGGVVVVNSYQSVTLVAFLIKSRGMTRRLRIDGEEGGKGGGGGGGWQCGNVVVWQCG